MAITPDTKDWTWVLERPCPECGFDAETQPREDLGRAVRDNAAAWMAALGRPGVARRPASDVWSCLEYGCHVRDVLRIYRFRVGLMLGEDGPTFQDWDQDATAVADRYEAQDPATVAAELADAADALAACYDVMAPEQWARRGTRSNGSRFTVGSLALYGLHDPIHHLVDVGRGA